MSATTTSNNVPEAEKVGPAWSREAPITTFGGEQTVNIGEMRWHAERISNDDELASTYAGRIATGIANGLVAAVDYYEGVLAELEDRR